MNGSNDDRQERTIYVSNLDSKVDEKILEEMFIQAGPIETINIKDQTRDGSRRYAFVEFSDVESVLFACEIMDGIELYRMKIKVLPRDNTKQKEIWQKNRSQGADLMRRFSAPQNQQQLISNQSSNRRHVEFYAQDRAAAAVSINSARTLASSSYGDRPTPIAAQQFSLINQIDTTNLPSRNSWPPPPPPPSRNSWPPPPPPPTFIPPPFQMSSFNMQQQQFSTTTTPSPSSNQVWANQPQSSSSSAQLLGIPPPPTPPDFYKMQVENINRELEKNGGRYRPNNRNISSRFESNYYTPPNNSRNGQHQVKREEEERNRNHNESYKREQQQKPYQRKTRYD